MEGFEPIETEGEQLQSDDQNSESLPEVTADETSPIPVLEGFEPIETEGEQLQSDEKEADNSPVSNANEIETAADSNSSLQRAKVAKRPTFIPDSSEEVDLEDEISSVPVLEGFEPIKGND